MSFFPLKTKARYNHTWVLSGSCVSSNFILRQHSSGRSLAAFGPFSFKLESGPDTNKPKRK